MLSKFPLVCNAMHSCLLARYTIYVAAKRPRVVSTQKALAQASEADEAEGEEEMEMDEEDAVDNAQGKAAASKK